MTGWKPKEETPLSKNVEAFALELVRLIRGVQVYPSKHPTLLGVAEKVLAGAPLDSTGLLTIGVTSNDLVVSGEFVGGKASGLAALLHGRKVLRISWTREARMEDVWTFARLLSTPKLEGEKLRRKLHSEGVYAIDLEPLQLDQIHREIADSVTDPRVNAERRRRGAWISLMNHETPADQVASAFVSEGFWEAAKTDWSDAGYGDSEGFTDVLIRLGERLEDALSLVPDQQREGILEYLAKMGKTLSPQDLVRIVAREGQEVNGIGQGTSSLLREIDGERFVDLLAGLAALGDQGTNRFAEVYRSFSPVAPGKNLLPIVRARLSVGGDSGFAAEVWKTVENFILKVMENPFMDQEYSESLESLAKPSLCEPVEDEELGPLDDPDECLDHVILGLATEGEDYWREKLLHRLELRTEQLGPLRVLKLVRLVDRILPGLLDSHPPVLRNLFKKGLSALSKMTAGDRQALANFTLTHESQLLDTVLKALAEEEHISTRYFLVSLLSLFSPAATPVFVSKARNGPWYVARNLAIVLGQQGFPQVLAPLRALSNHIHPKVRREAIKALKKVEASFRDSDRKDPCSEAGTLNEASSSVLPQGNNSNEARCP